ACRDIGRIAEAVEEYDLGVGLFTAAAGGDEEPGLVYPIFVSLCGWRSEALAALGRLDAALASATAGPRMATQLRHSGSLALANAFLGLVHLLRGELPTAVSVLERGLAISDEHELVHGICANGLYLAWSSFLMGSRTRGLECLDHALARP